MKRKRVIPYKRGKGMYLKPYQGKGYKRKGLFKVYNKNDTAARNKADLVLADQAWERVKSLDASIGERAAAYAIVNAMKAKAKLGMGLSLNKKYGQLSNIKICKKNPKLQRGVHAKRIKKSKKK